MNNVMYQTRMLNREIKHSNEYNQYIRTLGKLKEHEDLYERTKVFINRNFQIQSLADYNTLDDVAELRKEFEDVLTNPVSSEFLGAEQRVLGLLRRVEEGLLDGIQIDTTAIDEWD